MRKKQRFFDGIVMVGKMAANFFNGDIGKPSLIEDFAGGLGDSHAITDAYPDIFAVSSRKLDLGIDAQNQSWNHEVTILIKEIHIGSISGAFTACSNLSQKQLYTAIDMTYVSVNRSIAANFMP